MDQWERPVTTLPSINQSDDMLTKVCTKILYIKLKQDLNKADQSLKFSLVARGKFNF